MSLPKTAKMRSVEGDTDVPTIGFGTWAFGDIGWCYDATLCALRAGYRHIDCAWHYGVDEEVGRAILDSQVPRSELFITSKFWPQFGAPENVEKCVDLCFKDMGIDCLDLFLAHWPIVLETRSNISTAKAFPDATDAEKANGTSVGKAIINWTHTSKSIVAANRQEESFVPTWQVMQALLGTGKVRAVGVSNFNISLLQEILSVGGVVPVSCNQREEIMKTVFCPFAGQKRGSTPLISDPIVVLIAKKNEMGVGPFLQSWAVQRGTVPLGKSQTPARVAANLHVPRLAEEDIHRLSEMDQGARGRTVDLGLSWGVELY